MGCSGKVRFPFLVRQPGACENAQLLDFGIQATHVAVPGSRHIFDDLPKQVPHHMPKHTEVQDMEAVYPKALK